MPAKAVKADRRRAAYARKMKAKLDRQRVKQSRRDNWASQSPWAVQDD